MKESFFVRARGLFVVTTGAVLFGSGCVLPRDHEALVAKNAQNEKDVQDMRTELAKTRTDLDAARQRLDNALRANADSSTDVTSSKQRINDLAGRLDEVQHNVDDLKRDVAASRSELYARIDELKRTQPPAPTPAAPPVAIPQDKASHFGQLAAANAKHDFATVRVLGPEYVNRYPNDEHADEALFYMASADLEDGRPSSALGHYNRLLKLYPHSEMLDRTLFGMGEAYLLMHDCVNAKLAYEACEKRFSKTKIGGDARAKLQSIAKNPPGLCAPS